MKICILTTSTTAHQMGGTEVHAETLAKAVAAKGHTVTIITCAHPQGVEAERKNGYETFYLQGTHFSMSRKWLDAWWTKSAEKISEMSARGLVDIIWAENLTGQYYAKLPADGLKRPIIAIINGPAIRGEILNGWAQISSTGGLAYFLTRGLGQIFIHMLPWFRNAANHSDFIISVSDYTETEMKREFKASREKIKTIYNPVDTFLFRPDTDRRHAEKKRLGLVPLEPVLAMSGMMQKQKGMDLGLKAFHLIKKSQPDAKLIIAGDGPELGNLKRQTASLGLEKDVLFCGRLENSAMALFYNAADIYMIPTLRHEGLAIVIVEAMASGLPCIVSKAGGTASTIENGKSGFFTTPGDPVEIAEKALLLLHDHTLRKTMGENARKRALEVFSLDGIIRQYLEVSSKITGESKA